MNRRAFIVSIMAAVPGFSARRNANVSQPSLPVVVHPWAEEWDDPAMDVYNASFDDDWVWDMRDLKITACGFGENRFLKEGVTDAAGD